MAKTRTSKEQVVERVTRELGAGKGIVFADFTGLVVKELRELRIELRKAGVFYEVVKKTLLKRCLEAAGLSSVSVSDLKGSVSVAVSSVDEVVPAKTLSTFAKAHDKLRLLGGVFDGTFVNVSRVQALAQLPGKQELMGQLVGTVAAPLRGLVGVLQGNLRGLAQVLRAISQKP